MLCISLIAETQIPSAITSPAVYISRQRYAKPEPGILVHADFRRLDLGNGTVVRVDESFFQPGMPADQAVWIGQHIKILRASLRYDNKSGYFELTRETDKQDKRMIVYLDVGTGDGDRVTYEAKPHTLVARGQVSFFPYLISEEVALGLLSPDDSITAVRSGRRFVFWGERRVRETITYSIVDGVVKPFVFKP